MAIYQSDSRCTACKSWVTVYVTADDKPSSKACFRFICTCSRVVDGTGGVFAPAKSVPYGSVVADLLRA